uniref:TetR/AcrR family transcriptional regulator n=1 Tax=Methylobacterium sp. B34 TaxID=95563 RepID=UPI0009FF4183|nr:TetR/AcrR family transcriptional regulator [Methylobacterium sp. B34]
MAATLKRDVREAILVAAREAAMAYGYGGINFRDLAEAVGIKAASINYYFANKAILGEAVARRYWEDIARDLEAISTNAQSPIEALRQYPGIFRLSLERNNRMCLSRLRLPVKRLPSVDRGGVTPMGARPSRRIDPTRPISPRRRPGRFHLSQFACEYGRRSVELAYSIVRIVAIRPRCRSPRA